MHLVNLVITSLALCDYETVVVPIQRPLDSSNIDYDSSCEIDHVTLLSCDFVT